MELTIVKAMTAAVVALAGVVAVLFKVMQAGHARELATAAEALKTERERADKLEAELSKTRATLLAVLERTRGERSLPSPT